MKRMIITRVWHGITKAEHADAYLSFLENTGVPDYQKTIGNLSVEIWRLIESDICHFWTISKWGSIEDIKMFAGTDYEKAKYYEEDQKFLLNFEEKVKHMDTWVYT